MVGQLLLEFDYEISSFCETANYLDESRWGYYSLCCKPQQESRDFRVPFQRSYPLSTLPEVLKQAGNDKHCDYWITQAVFSQKNRRKVNLAHVGVAFVDLDYYKIRKLADLPPEAVLDLVLKRCQEWKIPLPSLVVDSGQGLQVKWFHEKLPRIALPRWEYLQTWLNQILLDLGADTGAKDISRILRVVQTVNQKNGGAVRVLWQQNTAFTQDPYSFNELIDSVHQAHIAHCRPVFTTSLKTRKGKKPKSKVVELDFRQSFSEDNLNWTRLCDLQKLNELRSGDMGEGLREPMAFYQCNFFALRYSDELALRPMDNWHEFYSLCRKVAPHWDNTKVRAKTSNLYQLTRDDAAGKTVEFMGKEYRPLLTPKNRFLIDLFGITDDEQRKLKTIISEQEIQRRKDLHQQTEDYKEAHRKRNKELQKAKRTEAGVKPREQYLDKAKARRLLAVAAFQEGGMSQREIAEKLGVSRGAVQNYLRKREEQQQEVRAILGDSWKDFFECEGNEDRWKNFPYIIKN
nr:winged helix-turn-helix domain-containing protein [Endozoicomonas sp.]